MDHMYSVTIYSSQQYKVLNLNLETCWPCPASLSPVIAMPASPWDLETLWPLHEHGLMFLILFFTISLPHPASGHVVGT